MEYDGIQDCLKIRGVTPEQELVDIWATHRLFRLLIDHLLKSSVVQNTNHSACNRVSTLDDQLKGSDGYSDRRSRGDTALISFLATAIDVTCHDELCTLVFRDPTNIFFVRLTMNPPELAIWWRDLLRCFDMAGWKVENRWLKVSERYGSPTLPVTIH